MENAVIRSIRAADIPAALEIYRPYVEETAVTFEYETPSLDEFSGRVRRVTEQFPWLVCETGGRIAGYAYAAPFHSRAAYQWACELSVYVAPNARRQGIGSALYRALTGLLREQGYYQAYAVITVPNEESSAFHQALGFERVGLLPRCGFKLGRWHGIEYRLLQLREPSPPVRAPAAAGALPRQTGKDAR